MKPIDRYTKGWDIIDERMIRTVSGDDDEIFDYLMSLSQDEQRPAILSILDKNIGLFEKIMDIMNGEYIPKAQHISNVVEMLRKYVKVADVEKKKFGEVMTPIWLVEDMLSKLPEDVWSNPDLKWLDPANGCGVFPSVIVKRLMDGLSEWEPDEDARYKHIVENMLYVCELQAKNMFLHLCAFDPEDIFLLNIFHGSFLSKEFDEHMKNEWCVEGFDIIVGNPPYQKSSDPKIGHKGNNHSLWDKFTIKSSNILNIYGLLCFVHPSNWRDSKGKFLNVRDIIRSLNVLYLEMHDIKDGRKTFGAATDYDWYVAKKDLACNKTTIRSSDGTFSIVDISSFDFLPNGNFNLFKRLLATEKEENVQVINDCSYHYRKDTTSKSKSRNYPYQLVYTCKTDGTLRLMYSSINNKGHFGIPKVIWSNGTSSVHIDKNGEYGLTQFAYAIVDEPKNLPMIKKALESKKFIELMKSCALNNSHRYNHKVIALFRKDFWKEFVVEPSKMLTTLSFDAIFTDVEIKLNPLV